MFYFLTAYFAAGLFLARNASKLLDEATRKKELPETGFGVRLVVLATVLVFWPLYVCYAILGAIFDF